MIELPSNKWITAIVPPLSLPEPYQADLWEISADYTSENDFLSPDEHVNSERMSNEIARNYQRNRNALREILAYYLAISARTISFTYSPSGKPYIADHPELQFNLSHCKDKTLVAISHHTPLGIDVEKIVSRNNAIGVARRMFTQHAVDDILNQPPERQAARFTFYWTAYEAQVKAVGKGIFDSNIPYSPVLSFCLNEQWIAAIAFDNCKVKPTIAHCYRLGV